MEKGEINNEYSYLKTIRRMVCILSLLVPFLSVLLLGGGELVISYFSSLHGSGAGYIVAQVISILKDSVTYSAFFLSLLLMGMIVMSFGAARSIGAFVASMMSTLISSATSFAVVYLLIIIGWHDMSLSAFFGDLDLNLTAAATSVIVTLLCVVCAYIFFWLSNPMNTYSPYDINFTKAFRIFFIAAVVIKVVMFVIDSIFSGISFDSVNKAMSTFIVPVLSDVLDLACAYFASRFAFGYLVKVSDRLSVSSEKTAFCSKKKGRK